MQNTTTRDTADAAPSGKDLHPETPLDLGFLSCKVSFASFPPTQRPAALPAAFRTPPSCLTHGTLLSALLIGLWGRPGFAESRKGGGPAPGDRVTVLENTAPSQQARINTLMAARAAETAGVKAVGATFRSNISAGR